MPTNKLPAWGDLGNGLYKNPVLNADFSDPDVIRVGEDFYMVCSDFHFMGIQVLHSRDLVNWDYIGRVYDALPIDPAYDQMQAYAKGSWAPALRYHDGVFYVYFCTPDEGLYMSRATNPAGPWEPVREVLRVAGWEDPCPFWDDDGNAYLGHSTWGAGPIILHRMSADGTKLLDDGRIVYVGKIAEGTKIYKRNGYYYLVIPEGGVEVGWQTVLRSRELYGPYERRIVLRTGNTNVNGPHQGALIELDDGESWFMHFQSMGALGRVCHLQPVRWEEDWPVMGVDAEPVSVWQKPSLPGAGERRLPASTDEFDKASLGFQWQWNHNPVPHMWSLTERPGYLRLRAMPAQTLAAARNTLTQKLLGPTGRYSARLEITGMADGQQAGLALLGGREENWIGVVCEGKSCRLVAVTGGVHTHGPLVKGGSIELTAHVNLAGETRFAFSPDGHEQIALGGACKLCAGFWKGVRPCLYSYNTQAEAGWVDVDWFRFEETES